MKTVILNGFRNGDSATTAVNESITNIKSFAGVICTFNNKR